MWTLVETPLAIMAGAWLYSEAGGAASEAGGAASEAEGVAA